MEIWNSNVNKDRKFDGFIYDLSIKKACSLKENQKPQHFLEQLEQTILCTFGFPMSYC